MHNAKIAYFCPTVLGFSYYQYIYSDKDYLQSS